MRILDLSAAFLRDRRIYSPHGSPHDSALRKALNSLISSRVTLPLAGDEEALRTPMITLWAHPVATTNLRITYSIALPIVRVHALYPVWRAG
ncbi:MAG: hypothetical protein ABJE95_10505 [Byssovorax sp.]